MFERKSSRLQTWDYTSSGMYYVTICTKDRKHMFGNIVDGKMLLSKYGRIVEECWNQIPNHFHHIRIDGFIIMPNHIHGIIKIVGDGFAIPALRPQGGQTPPLRLSLGKIMGWFKYKTTRSIGCMSRDENFRVWQRSYHDHIIRNDEDLYRIQQYIRENPAKWDEDEYR